MADPIIKPSGQQIVAVQSATNGGEPDFGATQMEEAFTKAFEEARPNPFTPKETEKPAATEQPAPRIPKETTDTPAEPPPPETPAPEVKATPRAAQWKEVNEERDRLRKENEAFKAEREKWSKSQIDRTEYDTIKKEREELLARMQSVALEKDPRFENYFKQKTDTAIALARQAVGDTHGERVAKLLQLPDSDFRTNQLEEVMAEIGTTRQARLGAAIVEMDRIHLERNTALAKSKENYDAMQKADRERDQANSQALERTFQDTLEKWSDPEKGLPLFQKKDGDTAHNAEVQHRVDNARKIINHNLNADDLSKAALWASSAPGLLKTLMATSEELKQAKAEIEALKAGGPELKTTEEETQVDEEKQYETMSYGEIIADKARKAGSWNT